MSRRMKWILGIGIPVCGILLAAGALIAVSYTHLDVYKRQALQQALDYIDDNVTNEMSAAEIAEKAGYSVYHLNSSSKMLSTV